MLRQISDAPLTSGWDFICDKYGINPYCMNEGLAHDDDFIEISLEDAEYIGLIEKD